MFCMSLTFHYTQPSIILFPSLCQEPGECSFLFSPGWPTRGVGNYGTGWMTRGPAPGPGLFSLLPAHKHTKSSVGRPCGINVNATRLFKGCHQVFQPKKRMFCCQQSLMEQCELPKSIVNISRVTRQASTELQDAEMRFLLGSGQRSFSL